MRLNVGIRRRLAPLMENSRPRIELLNGLLLSLPGTPVIYYGDEIGMGDNIYLGDRNGVRTPMQWTADRNGGFSRADPARLYAPLIMDSGVRLPVGQRRGAGAVAALAAELDAADDRAAPAAQDVRPRHAWSCCGRRTGAIFAFIRRHESEDPILVVANLSRTVQPVSLDLSRVLRARAGRDDRAARSCHASATRRTSSRWARTRSTGCYCGVSRRRR